MTDPVDPSKVHPTQGEADPPHSPAPGEVTQPEEEAGEVSPIVVHLEELRRRIIISIVFLAAGCIVGFLVTHKYLIKWILSPITAIPGARLQVLGPADQLTAYFKTAFLAGVVLAFPFILHQVWLFLRPGLKASERRFLLVLIPTSAALFTVGAAFIFYVMIPTALRFLLGIDLGVEIDTDITLDRYFSFVLLLVLAGGLIFQIPLVTYFLARVGLVSSQAMAERRKIAILGTVVLAAALTPTGDPINLLLLSLPIYILYEVSIIIAAVAYPKKD